MKVNEHKRIFGGGGGGDMKVNEHKRIFWGEKTRRSMNTREFSGGRKHEGQ